MASLIERLRARPENKPIYTEDGLYEDDLVPVKDQTTEQLGPVSPLTDIERILDCEMRPTLSDNPVSEQVFVKQYYVKWKGLSYLHCSWVPVQEFEEAYVSIPRSKLKSRVDKFDYEKVSVSNQEDFVAVRPEWTIVDRILSSRGEGDLKEYLVKFKGLPYDECYWEYESYISTFQKEIQRFKDINSGSRRDKYVGLKDFELFEHTPEFLTGMLHPFQLEGLNFLRFSWSNKTHVILADEMGLGKTIQSIAFLASLFEENQAPCLVVAPLPTLPNWEREFATWAPHMNVVMYSGSSEARTVIREHEFYFPKGHKTINSRLGGESKQGRIKFDVLLTSYEMINKDTTFVKPIKWKCMIVDEGHRLKNMDSKLFASLKQYSSKHRVLLTGTPLQNNLDELFVLMHFLDARKFGSLEEFQKEFKDINNEEQISRLHKMLGPHMLRRLKEDVLKDMPPKKELIVRVDLTNQQKEYYKAILTQLDDIIRYGTKELFAEENEEAGKSGKIHYDDAAIEKLLDRDHVDAEEVSLDVVEENGFLKAFKVANWEELLKDRNEAHQAEELNALGKRKRSCKQMLSAEEEDEVAGLEEKSDEDCEIQQNDDDDDGADDEEAEKGNHMARKPKKRRRARDNSERRPLMEGEGRSLKVLGFTQSERALFMKTLMRYGVGNYDWKEFENPFQKKKTYAEIKEYGILLLKHISEDTQDSSPTFSDGVPKEGLKRDDVLGRLAIVMLINEKIKNMEDHPTKPVFPDRILDRFPGLKTGRCWKEEHDKILIRALYKHGYKKWQQVVNDKELGIQKVICEELRFPYIDLNAAEQAAWEVSSLKRKNNNNASADGVNISSLHHYKDMQKRLVEFVKKRGHLLEKAINYEYAEEYYGTNGSVMMRAEQAGAGVVEADNEMLDRLPQRETITLEEVSAAAVDNNKPERVEVAQLYNKMCKNLNENSGKSVRTYINYQPPSEKLKNIFRPLESIGESMKKSASVTGTDLDVEMRDSVHESTLGSSKFMDLTMEEEETTKEFDIKMGEADVIILDD